MQPKGSGRQNRNVKHAVNSLFPELSRYFNKIDRTVSANTLSDVILPDIVLTDIILDGH